MLFKFIAEIAHRMRTVDKEWSHLLDRLDPAFQQILETCLTGNPRLQRQTIKLPPKEHRSFSNELLQVQTGISTLHSQ
ncbi:MAG: hypothetical protein ACI9TH_002732 [Kiritimatiellia bacterium]|jgi:hypothetical protein